MPPFLWWHVGELFVVDDFLVRLCCRVEGSIVIID